MQATLVFVQARKELQQFRRDPLTVALAFGLPVAALLLLGTAIRLEPHDIPLAVRDLDGSPTSRAYVERLFATNRFVPVFWPRERAIGTALDTGSARAAVIVPPEFSRRLRGGKTATVQLLVDGTDSNTARIVRTGVRQVTEFFGTETDVVPTQPGSEAALPTGGTVSSQARLWFNPGRREAMHIVPGTYAVILWIFPSLLAAIALVREKEQGTFVQIQTAPGTALEWLLGKALAYFAVALGMAFAVMVPGGFLFGLGLAGDPVPFVLGTVLFLATAVLFGLLVGVRTATQSAAVQASSTLGFLSALLFSGFIYPVANIPFPLSLLSWVIPARYYIELTRDAFVRGAGWEAVWTAPLALAVLGLAFFALARRGLQR